jgi:hypothetical protein
MKTLAEFICTFARVAKTLGLTLAFPGVTLILFAVGVEKLGAVAWNKATRWK